MCPTGNQHARHGASPLSAVHLFRLGLSITLFVLDRFALQAAHMCGNATGCFFFEVEHKSQSARQLAEWPGVSDAVTQLGYASTSAFVHDVQLYAEPLHLLSKFCVCPPGDTPKRRAFVDAIQMGCARWSLS